MGNWATSGREKKREARRIWVFVLAVALGGANFTCERSITVGAIGDQFGAENADSAYAVLEKAVVRVNAFQPDIVLHVGDLLESVRQVRSFDDYKSRFSQAVKIMNGLTAPWLMAVGDHDVVPPVFRPMSTDRSREMWFIEQSNAHHLLNANRFYYSYDVNDYHFIVLYSLENLHTDPRWGSIYLNKISDEQFAWLKSDLQNAAHAKGIIVLVHHPHWYVWQNWARIHDLLRRYPVAVVLAGHFHYDQDEGELDGIRYIVIGATGGAVKMIDWDSGGGHQYAVLKIRGRKLKQIILRDVFSNTEIELTSRPTMDRIQALTCMLDNLWQDEKLIARRDAIYTQDNCGKSSPVKTIGLESLSNPIDLPIQIAIGYNDVLTNPRWSSGEVAGDSALILPAGARVGWANYATVGQWSPLPPLWLADLKSPSRALHEGIELRIKITFNDGRRREMVKVQKYMVEKK